jgi:uncharacterized membrane protein
VSTRWGRRLQFAAAGLLVVAYASLSHYCNASGAHDLGAALALAPLTFLSLALVWRGTPPVVALLLSAGLATVLYRIWPLLEKHFALFYLVQESSIYGVLGLTFGRSLLPGRTALCTQLADKLHGPLSPRELLYTRHVTLAWAVFFFTVAAVSILLYLTAPLRVWSIYINFCVMPLVAAMFVAEYLVRQRVLPQVARAGLLATVRVYFANPE